MGREAKWLVSAITMDPSRFRALWTDVVDGSRLVDLRLPLGFYATGEWLQQVAARHSHLDHLSMTAFRQSVTKETFRNAVEKLARLRSLSVCLSLKSQGEADAEQALANQSSLGSVLDRLQLQALELSGENVRTNEEHSLPRPQSEIPSLTTTPKLTKILANLHIHYRILDEYVEHLLHHCRGLKILHLDDVFCPLYVDGGYPPLIQLSHQISPHLQSVTMAFNLQLVRACDMLSV